MQSINLLNGKTTNFVVLIPFKHIEDINKFAKKYNVKKYTDVYLCSRGKNHPKKFIMVIEEWDIPKKMWKNFSNQDWSLGYGSFNIDELKEIEKNIKPFKTWDNPYIYWKLINKGYIFFSANINKPLLICIQ